MSTPDAPVIVTLTWSEGSVPRDETFGPWKTEPDDSHMKAIRDFLSEWQTVTGQTIQRAVIALVQDPAEWLDAERERRRVSSE